MVKRGGAVAPREFRVLFGVGSTRDMTDRELLERFALDRGDGGALAFEALVHRHGSMVLRTCRKLLRDENDADDAFQATFLVLARKADRLWVTGTIGPWLHGVAYRIASRALSDRARRVRHEHRFSVLNPTTTAPAEPVDDLEGVLHVELERLAERFRSPLVLCYLEGLTHDQAALQLGWPVGTVRSRLARGRERLRLALGRRGISMPSVLPLLKLNALPAVTVRYALVDSAVRTATWVALGNVPAEVGPTVAGLSKGVLTTMAFTSLSKLAAGLLLTGLIATGAIAYASRHAKTSPIPRGSAPVARAPASTAHTAGRPQVPRRSAAELLADRILDEGSKRFNAKDSAGLAASYSEAGTIRIMGRDGQEQREEIKQGRAEVESFYRDFFRGVGSIESENTVDFARFATPELLIIHGRFRPDRGAHQMPFVQLRQKHDDQWLINTLWLFLQADAR